MDSGTRVLVAGVGLVVGGWSCAATLNFAYDAAFQTEQAVVGTIASGGNFTTRVLWNSTAESRAAYEFVLPVLPTGGSYTGATLRYNVNETTVAGSTASQLEFFGYAGNGRADIDDVGNTFLPQKVATSPMYFNTGISTLNLNTSRLNSLTSDESARWLGLCAWQYQYGHKTSIDRSVVPRVTYTANVPDVGTVSTRALFDARATGTSGQYSYTSVPEMNTQELGTIVDRRGVMEFSLAGIPAGVAITSAQLVMNVVTITTDGVDGPEPRIYGYTGNGVLDMNDATRTSTLLAGSQMISQLGVTTMTLDAAAIQALLASGNTLGLVFRGSADGRQFSFEGLQSNSPISLQVSYAVPEPGVVATGALVAGLATLRRRRDDRRVGR